MNELKVTFKKVQFTIKIRSKIQRFFPSIDKDVSLDVYIVRILNN